MTPKAPGDVRGLFNLTLNPGYDLRLCEVWWRKVSIVGTVINLEDARWCGQYLLPAADYFMVFYIVTKPLFGASRFPSGRRSLPIL